MSGSQLSSRLAGCLLGGALGDALGAPAELIMTLEKITAKFGPQGVTKFWPYNGYKGEKIKYTGVGVITDDTTQQASTLGAMMVAAHQPKRLQLYAHQAYLNWGVMQGDEALRILPHISLAIDWPDDVRLFWFNSGAGRGTIAALGTGRMGTIDKPLTYDTTIRGQRVIGPNEGSGGMMRVASLAFWPHAADKFKLGAENAALTHGHPHAYLASGAICALVEAVVQGHGLPDAFNKMAKRLAEEPQHEPVTQAIRAGWRAAQHKPSLEMMDELPSLMGHKDKFAALPVLAQTTYALLSHVFSGLTFKETLTLAVSHSGDSDSVGAIVGNVLGAKLGVEALPQDWLEQVKLRPQLEHLANKASQRLGF